MRFFLLVVMVVVKVTHENTINLPGNFQIKQCNIGNGSPTFLETTVGSIVVYTIKTGNSSTNRCYLYVKAKTFTEMSGMWNITDYDAIRECQSFAKNDYLTRLAVFETRVWYEKFADKLQTVTVWKYHEPPLGKCFDHDVIFFKFYLESAGQVGIECSDDCELANNWKWNTANVYVNGDSIINITGAVEKTETVYKNSCLVLEATREKETNDYPDNFEPTVVNCTEPHTAFVCEFYKGTGPTNAPTPTTTPETPSSTSTTLDNSSTSTVASPTQALTTLTIITPVSTLQTIESSCSHQNDYGVISNIVKNANYYTAHHKVCNRNSSLVPSHPSVMNHYEECLDKHGFWAEHACYVFHPDNYDCSNDNYNGHSMQPGMMHNPTLWEHIFAFALDRVGDGGSFRLPIYFDEEEQVQLWNTTSNVPFFAMKNSSIFEQSLDVEANHLMVTINNQTSIDRKWYTLQWVAEPVVTHTLCMGIVPKSRYVSHPERNINKTTSHSVDIGFVNRLYDCGLQCQRHGPHCVAFTLNMDGQSDCTIYWTMIPKYVDDLNNVTMFDLFEDVDTATYLRTF